MNKSSSSLSRSSLTEFIAARIDDLEGRRSAADLAKFARFASVHTLQMIRTGEVALPLDRVPDLARALESDPRLLFKLALAQMLPERMVDEVIVDPMVVSLTKTFAALIQAEILQAERRLNEMSDHDDHLGHRRAIAGHLLNVQRAVSELMATPGLEAPPV